DELLPAAGGGGHEAPLRHRPGGLLPHRSHRQPALGIRELRVVPVRLVHGRLPGDDPRHRDESRRQARLVDEPEPQLVSHLQRQPGRRGGDDGFATTRHHGPDRAGREGRAPVPSRRQQPDDHGARPDDQLGGGFSWLPGTGRLEREGGKVTAPRGRHPIALVLWAWGTVTVAALPAPVPLRVVALLGFVGLCPGLALVGLLERRDPLERLVLSVALSLALGVLVTEAMAILHLWSTVGGLAVLA